MKYPHIFAAMNGFGGLHDVGVPTEIITSLLQELKQWDLDIEWELFREDRIKAEIGDYRITITHEDGDKLLLRLVDRGPAAMNYSTWGRPVWRSWVELTSPDSLQQLRNVIQKALPMIERGD